MQHRKKPLDALLVLARASLRDRRRRSPVRFLVTGLVLVVLLALPVYFLWPGAPPAPLLLAAFDQVALPGESVALHASLEPVSANPASTNLARCPLYFHEPMTDWQARLLTDRAGQVVVSSSFEFVDKPIEVTVRFPGDEPRQPPSQAKLRIFLWPADTRLLLVDVEGSLPRGEETDLWSVNNLDLRPQPGAVAALRALRQNYHISYVAKNAARPTHYQKLRAWLERSWAAETEQFPDGPVLVPGKCGGERGEGSVHALLKELHARYPGCAVTATAANAQLFREAGWQTYLLDHGEPAPEGITVVPSWSALPKRLP